MFKSCCARPNKKISKSKSKAENMDKMSESNVVKEKDTLDDNSELKNNLTLQVTNEGSNPIVFLSSNDENQKCQSEKPDVNRSEEPLEDSASDVGDADTLDLAISKIDLNKKRYSVDYKRSRLDFKRYSVDCRRNSATLDELTRLEEELARTNVDVRPGIRRKSTGILKSSTNSNSGIDLKLLINHKESGSDDDEVFVDNTIRGAESEGPKEPPATPVGRDELALRRHRFFSDLVCAARAAVEHRVRFDPLGPVVADPASEAEAAAASHSPASEFESLIERLERVTSRLERLPLLRERSSSPPRSPEPASPPSPPSPPSLPQESQEVQDFSDIMSVVAYQELVQGPVKTFLDLSREIGGEVYVHASLAVTAFQAQLRYLELTATQSKPAKAQDIQLLTPTSEQINAVQQYREKHRSSQFFNHLSAISESIPALGWVAVTPAPAPYVKEMNDAGQFYTNRVLKEWKEKECGKLHVEWCRAWVHLLNKLQAYVKQYHTTGVVWASPGKATAPPPPPSGMPPPPPTLPETDFSNLSVDDRSALFAEINQGEGITNTLRKVTADMQTHKNPSLRQGPAPFKAAGGGAGGAGGVHKPLPQPGAGMMLNKAPVFMRDGKKWLIEYQNGNRDLIVENADMNNVVYMFRCRESALTVNGKVNGVVLDSCTKCVVVFDNLVSSIEFVNCQSVQMQVLGKVPTISIDKTDGCQIYLSPDSLDVEIVSSKSSEMNVLLPKNNGDFTEHPIPEQYKTVLNNSQSGIVTSPVENKG